MKDFDTLSDNKKKATLAKLRIKYPIKMPSFISDGLAEHPHFSPITKMVFISRGANGVAKFGALDQEGVISVWSVLEIHGENLTSEYNLNMNIGCKLKLQLNFSDSLTNYPNVLSEDDPLGVNLASESVEIEFDTLDPQIFFFSTSRGLFRIDKSDVNSLP